jgi:hypothetical protein
LKRWLGVVLGVVVLLGVGGVYFGWRLGFIRFGPEKPITAVSSSGLDIASLREQQELHGDAEREAAQVDLIACLSDPDDGARADATRAAANLLSGTALVLERATDADAETRAGAAHALGQVGVLGSAGVTQLVRLLGDQSRDASQAAIASAQAVGDDFRPVLPALIELLNDDDADVRVAAALAIEAFDAEMATSLEAHPPMLEGAGFLHRMGIERSIEEFGISRANCKTAFRDSLDDDDARVVEVAERALANAVEE